MTDLRNWRTVALDRVMEGTTAARGCQGSTSGAVEPLQWGPPLIPVGVSVSAILSIFFGN